MSQWRDPPPPKFLSRSGRRLPAASTDSFDFEEHDDIVRSPLPVILLRALSIPLVPLDTF